ncbi:hypothetical protein V8E54_004900 [Elaphomyces granulatus]
MFATASLTWLHRRWISRLHHVEVQRPTSKPAKSLLDSGSDFHCNICAGFLIATFVHFLIATFYSLWNSQPWKLGPCRSNDEIWTHLCLVLRMATSSTPRCSISKVRKVFDKTAKGTPYHRLRIGTSSSDEPMIYESIKRLSKRKRTLSSESSASERAEKRATATK